MNLSGARLTSGEDDIMLITYDGKSISFTEEEVKSSNRDTKGVKGITLKKGDYVMGVEAFDPKEIEEKKVALLIITENGLGKRTLLSHYPLQKRSGLGVKVSDITKRTGKIASAKLIGDDHREVVISTKEGQTIKLPLLKKSIPMLTRPTQGVILMKLKSTDKVVAVALTSDEEEEEE
jgi:DNA gyrase subunit A